ncbi:hypothetical protein HK100_000145 [Physocladia obscura]|uniref:Translation elongation factor KOW-like domain-containing protein n=1 Tax=Physocladia obscura TaxID=109957 RepID=A0AAD5XH60_9FUNG|nr:hypothetical protein HK100_000145 [Physocladia obscura]
MQLRGYRLSATEIKKGLVVSSKNKLWLISDFAQHTQGRYGSHYKIDLIPFGASASGGKVTERYSPDDFLEGLFALNRLKTDSKLKPNSGVDLKARTCRLLYQSEGIIHFLDRDTMEEVECNVNVIEGKKLMINDDMDVVVQCLDNEEDNGEVVSIRLPSSGIYKIAHAEPTPSIVSNEGKEYYAWADPTANAFSNVTTFDKYMASWIDTGSDFASEIANAFGCSNWTGSGFQVGVLFWDLELAICQC